MLTNSLYKATPIHFSGMMETILTVYSILQALARTAHQQSRELLNCTGVRNSIVATNNWQHSPLLPSLEPRILILQISTQKIISMDHKVLSVVLQDRR